MSLLKLTQYRRVIMKNFIFKKIFAKIIIFENLKLKVSSIILFF